MKENLKRRKTKNNHYTLYTKSIELAANLVSRSLTGTSRRIGIQISLSDSAFWGCPGFIFPITDVLVSLLHQGSEYLVILYTLRTFRPLTHAAASRPYKDIH
jgi:hypothetical protein